MTLSSAATLTVMAGAIGLAAVLALGLSNPQETSGLIGVTAGTVVGIASLILKSNISGEGAKEVRSAMAMQGITFGLRFLSLLIGAFALRNRGLDPIAFVFAFFGCYLVQHIVELRFVLSKRAARVVQAGEVGR